ncbi:MAG: bifunctional folylpolyglutamate synthase/dihydrofolate synthase [Candidatus Altiarchaeota archaeon]|nr:bifunctional folylpolyglutamate synthase/dihydrofolate synthase [Candidatus Altiarchaeota archaeon]
MNIKQTCSYLKSLDRFGIRLRLDHSERLLSLLKNPHKKLKCIHVAGTNGKGSVCAYLDSILRQAGFKVGLYTSPHFYKLNERMKINGKPISDSRLSELASRVRPLAERVSRELGDLTFFEVTTAMAFLYFAENDVDYVVLEAGLGGRLDATNVATPLVSVITGISREHTLLLGNSIRQIAGEKAAIIKPRGLVVTAASGVALKVIDEACRRQNAVLCVVGDESSVRRISHGIDKQTFQIDFFGIRRAFAIGLLGRHQLPNAAVAFSVIQMLKTFHRIEIPDDAVSEGFLAARLPCRLEVMRGRPLVVLDGAHNPDGIRKLVSSLRDFNYKKLIVVFGCSHDKEIKPMAKSLGMAASRVFVAETRLAKPLGSGIISAEFKKYLKQVHVEKDVRKAVKKAISVAASSDLVLVAGSLYVAGEARRIWHPNL